MESMESHEAGFPPFPHSHGVDGWIYVFNVPAQSNHHNRKGLVTDVSGPERNARHGTLTAYVFEVSSLFSIPTKHGGPLFKSGNVFVVADYCLLFRDR